MKEYLKLLSNLTLSFCSTSYRRMFNV